MDAAQFHNLLAKAKDVMYDTAERAVLLDDPDVRAVCAAWPNCRKRIRYGRPLKKQPMMDRYNDLWDGVIFVAEDLRRMSGVPRHRFIKAWAVAHGNRLIFPDGTLANYVQLKLQALVVSGLPRRRTEPPKKDGQ